MSQYENIESKGVKDFSSSNSLEFDANVPSISCDDTSDDLVKETFPLVTPSTEQLVKPKDKESNGICCIMAILIVLTISIIVFIVVLVLVFLYLLLNHHI